MFDRGGVILGSKGLWLYDCVVLKKRYSGNTGQKDKRKAKTWVEDFKAAKRREAANSIIGIQADPTFDCHFLLQEWLANHSGKHASNVKADWDNYILPKIGSTPVMKVTTGMVEEIRTNYIRTPSFLNVKGKVADRMKAKALQTKAEGKQPKEKVSKPKTNNGANKVINHLNFVFSWGVKTDRLPRMPFKKLKKLVEQEAVKTFLRPEQVKPFLSEIDSLNNLPVMVMIRAMLYIGLREGEAVAMKWTGFDEGRKVFTASNAVEIGLINVASAYIREIKGIGYTLNPELIDLMKEWRRACGLPEVDTARKASGEREKAREGDGSALGRPLARGPDEVDLPVCYLRRVYRPSGDTPRIQEES